MGEFTITQSNPNAESTYLYPDADSGCNNWDASSGDENYSLIDESKYELDLTNYVYTESTSRVTDYYSMDTLSDVSTVNFVKFHCVADVSTPPSNDIEFRLAYAVGDDVYDAPEDFSDADWIKTEDGNSTIVVSGTEIRYNYIDLESDTFTYKEFDSDFTNFTHCFEFEYDNYDDGKESFTIWGLELTVGNLSVSNFNEYSGFGSKWICLKWDDGVYKLEARKTNGDTNTDTYNDGVTTDRRYITVVRDTTAETVIVYIYSDEDKETLLDTLSITDPYPSQGYDVLAIGCSPDGSYGYGNPRIDVLIDNVKLECEKSCSNTLYESNEKNLTSGYRNVREILKENPSTSSAWTQEEINAGVFGFVGKSYLDSDTWVETTLRPNGEGDVTELIPKNRANNYQCVDEEVANGTTDYVTSGSFTDNLSLPAYDLYELSTDSNLTNSTIDRVKIYTVVSGNDSNESANIVIKTHGTEYRESVSYGYGWVLRNTTLSTNPNTGSAWTKDEIDDLQVGIEFIDTINSCTQMYVIVYYRPDSYSPDLRVYNFYIEANYIPESRSCTLSKPTTWSTDHDRVVNMINFWDGTREVYDLYRGGKRAVLKGVEYSSDNSFTPCDRITCMRTLANNGATITLSDTGMDCLDHDYKILSFGWKLRSKKPQVYEWMLELEYTELE